ncbi:hypothetical protein [Neptunicella sp.]|uniref:hypothetical protein n=1 Tax=Neptunicella sp. TaxID=2125986 RepID=UPI003F69431E
MKGTLLVVLVVLLLPYIQSDETSSKKVKSSLPIPLKKQTNGLSSKTKRGMDMPEDEVEICHADTQSPSIPPDRQSGHFPCDLDGK